MYLFKRPNYAGSDVFSEPSPGSSLIYFVGGLLLSLKKLLFVDVSSCVLRAIGIVEKRGALGGSGESGNLSGAMPRRLNACRIHYRKYLNKICIFTLPHSFSHHSTYPPFFLILHSSVCSFFIYSRLYRFIRFQYSWISIYFSSFLCLLSVFVSYVMLFLLLRLGLQSKS